MNWFRNFMAGRYGGDQLSIALLVLSVLINMAASLSGLRFLIYIGYIPLVLSILRMFSKDVNRRRMENYKFNLLISPIYGWIKRQISYSRDVKTHKHFKCPDCKARLRIPRGKGKIVITCPKCKNEFAGKS